MKILIFAISVLILSRPAFSCSNTFPKSTSDYAIANNGAGLEKEMDCSKRPDEKCVCFDGVSEWSVVEYMDRMMDDTSKPIYQDHCNPELEMDCVLTGYEKKIDELAPLMLVNNPTKLAALTAKTDQEKTLEVYKAQAAKERQNCIDAHLIFKARKAMQGLADAEKIQLAGSASVKAVIDALETYSIPYAMAVINAYVADGILVTEADKTAMFAELSK